MDALKEFLLRQSIKIFKSDNPNELIISPKHTLRLELEEANDSFIQTIEDLTKEPNKITKSYILALSPNFTFISPRYFRYNEPCSPKNLLDLILAISTTIELFESLKEIFDKSVPKISSKLIPSHLIRWYDAKTYSIQTQEKTSRHFKEFFLLIDKNAYESNSTSIYVQCFYLTKLKKTNNEGKAKNASSKAKMIFDDQISLADVESPDFIKEMNLMICRDLIGLTLNTEIF